MTDSERKTISERLQARTEALKAKLGNRRITKEEYQAAKTRRAVAVTK